MRKDSSQPSSPLSLPLSFLHKCSHKHPLNTEKRFLRRVVNWPVASSNNGGHCCGGHTSHTSVPGRSERAARSKVVQGSQHADWWVTNLRKGICSGYKSLFPEWPSVWYHWNNLLITETPLVMLHWQLGGLCCLLGLNCAAEISSGFNWTFISFGVKPLSTMSTCWVHYALVDLTIANKKVHDKNNRIILFHIFNKKSIYEKKNIYLSTVYKAGNKHWLLSIEEHTHTPLDTKLFNLITNGKISETHLYFRIWHFNVTFHLFRFFDNNWCTNALLGKNPAEAAQSRFSIHNKSGGLNCSAWVFEEAGGSQQRHTDQNNCFFDLSLRVQTENITYRK